MEILFFIVVIFSVSSFATRDGFCHAKDCELEDNLKNVSQNWNHKSSLKMYNFHFQQCIRRNNLIKNLFKEKGISNFKCSLLETKNPQNCEKVNLYARDFFTDYEVLKRIFQPKHYFSVMPNVALFKVFWI